MRVLICAVAAMLALADQSPGEQRRTATLSYDGSYISTLIDVHSGSGTVALDGAGNVYFGDGYRDGGYDAYSHSVYRLAKGATVVEAIYVGAVEIRGFAVDPAGTHLYLGLGPYGLTSVDIATHAAVQLAGFWRADAVAIHPTTGRLYVSTFGPYYIVSVAPAGGAITRIAGLGPRGYSGDGGAATDAGLYAPRHLTFDAAGNLFIAESDAHRIRRIDAVTGVITTIAGTGVPADWGDGGPAATAMLSYPSGLATDAAGNLYVADTYNYHVRKIDVATGLIQTVAGGVLYGEDGDGGPPLGARLFNPYGLAIDTAGNLYIRTSLRIRTVTVRSDDVPLIGDLDGDGKAELVVWRPGTGAWSWLTSASGYDVASAQTRSWTGVAPGDVPLLADMDGDGRMDPILFQPATGTWSWLTSSSNFSTASVTSKVFGDASQRDVPMPGDIDGDGKADLVVWRASTGTWYWLLSSAAFAPSSLGSKQWGNQFYGDLPLRADFDGDGRMDLTVWRADTGTWYWLASSNGYAYGGANLRQWGSQNWADVPLTAVLDGDAKSEIVVWRQKTGEWFWLKSTQIYAYAAAEARAFGASASADIPLLGDIDGDGRGDLVRWSAATGTWYWLTAAAGHSGPAQGGIVWGSTR